MLFSLMYSAIVLSDPGLLVADVWFADVDGADLSFDPQPARPMPSATVAMATTPALSDDLIRSPVDWNIGHSLRTAKYRRSRTRAEAGASSRGLTGYGAVPPGRRIESSPRSCISCGRWSCPGMVCAEPLGWGA